MTLDLTAEIKPGQGIGNLELGMSLDSLLGHLRELPIEKERTDLALIIKKDPFTFYIDPKTQKLDQIGVGEGFKGKLLGQIQVGSTLKDLQDVTGCVEEEIDLYRLDGTPGISFELYEGSKGDWSKAKIGKIYVLPKSG